MFNPTSHINANHDMDFHHNNSNNNNNNNKKLPNPSNFKIVKCKNFERGIINLSISNEVLFCVFFSN